MALLRECLPDPTDDDAAAARDALVDDGLLARGRGRGGSIYLANVADPELTSPEATVTAAAASTTRRKAVKRTERPPEVLPCRHGETRMNNPKVGMVHAGTDPDGETTTRACDPHPGPVLNVNSARAGIETLIDDALEKNTCERRIRVEGVRFLFHFGNCH